MYLDQHGFVRACCMNEIHVLGNVRNDALVDIWRGERADRLRRAMERDDLSLGCDFCRWPMESGRPDLAFARWFSELPVTPDPDWPRQLEFSVSNTCNLQCVMCNGEWSSSIRSQREGLAPLPKVYDDEFFEGLAPFLPHLERVKFLGGEPFLAGETLRIMEMLVEAGSRARCHATTNGTQWSPRVERILDMLPMDISVSLDAATAATHAQIRIGADWDEVRRNLDRFRERAARRGTHVSITMCLMTHNWHEFADFCLLADSLGVSCDVNTVTQPTPMSLYHLSADELAVVVEGLEARSAELDDATDWTRATWAGELTRLRNHLADRRADVPVMGIDLNQGQQVAVRPWDRGDELREEAAEAQDDAGARSDRRRVATVGPDSYVVRLDDADRIVGGDDEVFGIPVEVMVGRQASDLMEVFSERLGAVVAVETGAGEEDDRTLEARLADGRRIAVFTTPDRRDGRRVGTQVHLAWTDA
jgi:MoaA/NifB/PqqE/SkfB family radical SAM enzyme